MKFTTIFCLLELILLNLQRNVKYAQADCNGCADGGTDGGTDCYDLGDVYACRGIVLNGMESTTTKNICNINNGYKICSDAIEANKYGLTRTICNTLPSNEIYFAQETSAGNGQCYSDNPATGDKITGPRNDIWGCGGTDYCGSINCYNTLGTFCTDGHSDTYLNTGSDANYEYDNVNISDKSQGGVLCCPIVNATLAPSVTPSVTSSVTSSVTPSVTPSLTPSLTPTLLPSSVSFVESFLSSTVNMQINNNPTKSNSHNSNNSSNNDSSIIDNANSAGTTTLAPTTNLQIHNINSNRSNNNNNSNSDSNSNSNINSNSNGSSNSNVNEWNVDKIILLVLIIGISLIVITTVISVVICCYKIQLKEAKLSHENKMETFNKIRSHRNNMGKPNNNIMHAYGVYGHNKTPNIEESKQPITLTQTTNAQDNASTIGENNDNRDTMKKMTYTNAEGEGLALSIIRSTSNFSEHEGSISLIKNMSTDSCLNIDNYIDNINDNNEKITIDENSDTPCTSE